MTLDCGRFLYANSRFAAAHRVTLSGKRPFTPKCPDSSRAYKTAPVHTAGGWIVSVAYYRHSPVELRRSQ